MLNEHLAALWTNVHGNEQVSIHLYGSDTLSDSESILIKNGFFLWCGITLEKACAVLSDSSYASFGGRMLLLPSAVFGRQEGFHSFLELLDEVDDIITSIISSDSSEFKAQALYKELHSCLSRWSTDLCRTLSPLLKSLLSGVLTPDTVSFLRQWSNLLSKISIDRSDLLGDHYSEYFESEWLSFAEASVQSAKSLAYSDMIIRIRHVLEPLVKAFDMSSPIPKHGPGAVADSTIKTKLSKYLNMEYDGRIDYLLKKGNEERMGNYSPFELRSGGTRTSRVVFVPKTWKKLRGISAEPVGLQFFQQAVARSIVDAIDKTVLSRVINLRDQSISRRMALSASRNRKLATIDLSSASDSVTLRLVKDIFGNTNLCRWLLATRSTHTLINNQRIRINKFAPMGSACCFPVECVIFAAIVLASAAKRHKSYTVNYRDFRVFGDDIICPSFLAEGVMDDLTLMGFTVNDDKSYHIGDYRESCGMDAWKGHDVTPLKLRDFSYNFDGSCPLSYEHHSRCVSYLNSLYFRGYKAVRSFLLKKLLDSHILAKSQRLPGRKSLVFGDGSRGTIASTHDTNFHLDFVPLQGLQRPGVKAITWKPRRKRLSIREEILLSEVDYFENLLSRRTISLDDVASYDLNYFLSLDSKLEGAIVPAQQMVPSLSTIDRWYY